MSTLNYNQRRTFQDKKRQGKGAKIYLLTH